MGRAWGAETQERRLAALSACLPFLPWYASPNSSALLPITQGGFMLRTERLLAAALASLPSLPWYAPPKYYVFLHVTLGG